MAVIRIAIIGLSSTTSGWAGNAHIPYLLSPRGRARFEIFALYNSSVEAAQLAIAKYDLLPSTKAYGNPEALAADLNVDLVVCCTRVDTHHDLVIPSVRAGKAIYLEWPLAHDLEHVRSLVSAARQSQSQTAAGIQGRYAPVIEKMRQLLRRGRVGKILSVEVRAAGVVHHPAIFSTRLKYFTEKSIGGNMVTIYFGHLFDQIQYVVGDIVDAHGHTQIQRPELRLEDPTNQATAEVVVSDVPDLIITTGRLQASNIAVENATVLSRFRVGSPFPNEPALVWSIVGELGEIRLTAEISTTLQAHGYDKPVTLEVRDFDSDAVEVVQWKWAEWQEDLPVVARSVGALYEEIAKGREGKVPSFEEALIRHEQIEALLS